MKEQPFPACIAQSEAQSQYTALCCNHLEASYYKQSGQRKKTQAQSGVRNSSAQRSLNLPPLCRRDYSSVFLSCPL